MKEITKLIILTVALTISITHAKVFKASGSEPLEVWLPKSSKNVTYQAKKITPKKSGKKKKRNKGLRFSHRKGQKNQEHILRVTADGIKQSDIVLSEGTRINQPDEFPTGYANYHPSAKQQFLIQASELHSAGFKGSSTISALSFYVEHPIHAFFTHYKGIKEFTIRMGHTMQRELLREEHGLITVHQGNNIIEQQHWNLHDFSQPFHWDGYRNIVIELSCKSEKHSANAAVLQNSTPFHSSLLRVGQSSSISTVKQRPTMRLSLAGNAHEPLVMARGLYDKERNDFYGISSSGAFMLWENDTWNTIQSSVVGSIKDIVLLSNGALCALNNDNEIFVKASSTSPWAKHKARRAPVTLDKIGRGNESDVILGLDDAHQQVYQLEAQGWKLIAEF